MTETGTAFRGDARESQAEVGRASRALLGHLAQLLDRPGKTGVVDSRTVLFLHNEIVSYGRTWDCIGLPALAEALGRASTDTASRSLKRLHAAGVIEYKAARARNRFGTVRVILPELPAPVVGASAPADDARTLTAAELLPDVPPAELAYLVELLRLVDLTLSTQGFARFALDRLGKHVSVLRARRVTPNEAYKLAAAELPGEIAVKDEPGKPGTLSRLAARLERVLGKETLFEAERAALGYTRQEHADVGLRLARDGQTWPELLAAIQEQWALADWRAELADDPDFIALGALPLPEMLPLMPDDLRRFVELRGVLPQHVSLTARKHMWAEYQRTRAVSSAA